MRRVYECDVCKGDVVWVQPPADICGECGKSRGMELGRWECEGCLSTFATYCPMYDTDTYPAIVLEEKRGKNE